MILGQSEKLGFFSFRKSLLELTRKEILYTIFEFLKPLEIDTVIRRLSQQLNYVASKSEFWEAILLPRYRLVDLLRLEPYVMAERRSKGRVQRGRMMGTQEKFLVRTVSLETTNAGRDDGVPTSCLREVSLLTHLRHPNLVTCYAAIVEGSVVQIVSEYVETNLSLCLESLSGSRVNSFVVHDLMRQLLSAVQCLHERGIIHRNIKPDNILLRTRKTGSGLELKLGDLALGRSIDIPMDMYTPEDPKERERSYREQRRLYNRAPEVILRQPIYGLEIDMWSVGCVFLELVIGSPAFRCESEIGLLFSTFQLCGTPDVRIWNRLSPSSSLFFKLPIWNPIDFRAVAATLLNEKTRFSGHLSPYLSAYSKQTESVRMLLKFGSILGVSSLHLLERLLIIPGCFRITATEALAYPYFSHRVNDTSLHPDVQSWIESFFKDYSIKTSDEALTSILYYQRFIQYQKLKEQSLLSNKTPYGGKNELFIFIQTMEERWNLFFLDLKAYEWIPLDYLDELDIQDESYNSNEEPCSDQTINVEDTATSDHKERPLCAYSSSSSLTRWSSFPLYDHATERKSTVEANIQGTPVNNALIMECRKSVFSEKKNMESDDRLPCMESLSKDLGNVMSKPTFFTSLRYKRARFNSLYSNTGRSTQDSPSIHKASPTISLTSKAKYTSSPRCPTLLTQMTLPPYNESGTARLVFQIHPFLRVLLVNFIFGIQSHFYLKSQTIHMAIAYFDRYIALISKPKGENGSAFLSPLELVSIALASLKIADLNNEISKEYYKQDNIAEYVSYLSSSPFTYYDQTRPELRCENISVTTKQLLDKEKLILNTLQFDLVVPTLYWFLNAFLSVAKLLPMTYLVDYCYVMTGTYLCLYNHQMVTLRPSLKAQVVLLFGCCTLFRPMRREEDPFFKDYQEALEPSDSDYTMYLFKLLTKLFTYRDIFSAHNTVWDVFDCVTLMRHLLMHGRRYFELKKIKNVEQKHPWASHVGFPTPRIPTEALRFILPSSQDSILDSLL